MANSEALYDYHYDVKTSAGAVFISVIFMALILGHIWNVVTTQDWFGLTTVSGGIFKFVGLASRACSHSIPDDRAPFTIQTVFIFLAPFFFAAAMHLFLGQLIRASGHKHLAFVRLDWYFVAFCGGDLPLPHHSGCRDRSARECKITE